MQRVSFHLVVGLCVSIAVGKVQKVFEEVSTLPRRQQERVVEMVSALVEQYKRKMG